MTREEAVYLLKNTAWLSPSLAPVDEAIGIVIEALENEETHETHDIEDAPTIGGWIPCSERLPKNDGYYLITLSDNSLDVAYYEIGTNLSQWHCGAFEDGRVIAWMPLPEPYKEQTERSSK